MVEYEVDPFFSRTLDGAAARSAYRVRTNRLELNGVTLKQRG